MAYAPHQAQMLVHRARRTARFRTVVTGRRFGKTLMGAAELIDCAGGDAAGDYAWVAPTYAVAERGVDAFGTVAGPLVEITGQNPRIGRMDGPLGESRFFFLSADKPDAIRGYGFRGMVIDEAAYCDVNVWTKVLRPTLSDHLGWALFISTPCGRNWFYDLFTRGKSGEDGFASFSFPSLANPYFTKSEWEEAKRTLPEDVFRQEYLGEFLEDSAGVFRGVRDCTAAAVPGAVVRLPSRVVIGVDLAKHCDFTVCIAMDAATGELLEMDRFNQIDWPFQMKRIVAFAEKWGGTVCLDSTGVGDPVFDALQPVLPGLYGFKINSVTKRELVQGLMLAIENQSVRWPAAWEVLTLELERYEYSVGPTGNISYNAPAGYHDDCVMALALAQFARSRFGAPMRGCVPVSVGHEKRLMAV